MATGPWTLMTENSLAGPSISTDSRINWKLWCSPSCKYVWNSDRVSWWSCMRAPNPSCAGLNSNTESKRWWTPASKASELKAGFDKTNRTCWMTVAMGAFEKSTVVRLGCTTSRRRAIRTHTSMCCLAKRVVSWSEEDGTMLLRALRMTRGETPWKEVTRCSLLGLQENNPSTEEDSWRPSWRGWRSLSTWARTLTLCSRLSASPSVQHCSTSCSKVASTLPLALSCSIMLSMPPLGFASGSSRTSAMQSHTRKLKMAHTMCWSVQSSGHRWSQLRKWSWSWRWSQLCRWLWIPLRRRVSACCSNLNSRHPLSESWTPTDDNQIYHVAFIYHFLYNLYILQNIYY